MSLKFQNGRLPAVLALVIALTQNATPREARAGNVWDWLFPSRNHSYYAGAYGPAQGQGQVGMPPAGANYGGTQPVAAGQPNWNVNSGGPLSNQGSTTAGYEPTASYPANQYPGTQPYSGDQPYQNAQALGTTQQLTNPLVIIPASSAPIAGPSGSNSINPQAGTTTGYPGYPQSPMSAGGGASANGYSNGTATSNGTVYSGYAPSGYASSGYSSGGLVSSGYGTTGAMVNGNASLSTAMMPGQTQQVFMMNQATQLGNCSTCLPGHSRLASSYRTVWYRVPTTNFRPVAAVDPCTGLQTTVMRPCTTFRWQARRVPTMRSPSLCERLFSCFRRPPPPTFPMAPTAMTTHYACGSGCGSMPAPYYSPPATSAPAGVAPAGGISPWGGTSLPATGYPSGSYPSGSYPSGSYPSGGTSPYGTAPSGASPPLREPADERPSLEPRRYAPQDSENGGGNGENWPSQDPGLDRGLEYGDDEDLDYDNAANYTPSAIPPIDRSPSLRGPQFGRPQIGGSSGASSIRASQEPSETRGKAPQPVPDPDALLNSPQRFEPPQLLNPKDRRASQAVQRAGDYVLASWPDSPPTTSRDSAVRKSGTVRKAGTARQAIEPPLHGSSKPSHDSGWRSVPR